jgi:D-sedoheptulose 7-phosphate isomerase
MKFKQYQNDYFKTISEALNTITDQQTEILLNTILRARDEGKKILFAGNGGSALNASHFAMGISLVSKKWSRPIRTYCLSESAATMSSLSNDYNFNEYYSKLIEVNADKGDTYVVLSSSGNSENLVNSVLQAKKMGVSTFALLGSDGGKLKDICDGFIHIPCEKNDPGYAEDIHMIIGHILTGYLEHHID